MKIGPERFKLITFPSEVDFQTPNFRNFLKEIDEQHPGKDWKKLLYDLFPMQPARQAVRVSGLPKPYGKGGY